MFECSATKLIEKPAIGCTSSQEFVSYCASFERHVIDDWLFTFWGFWCRSFWHRASC